MSDYKVVIPARYGSSRLPGKPLRLLQGKPMIWHVVERAKESGASQILVATDDSRIQQAAEEAGVEVCLTDPAHNSGTERLAEVVACYGWSDETILVNLQGDEPTMPAQLLDQVAQDMAAHPDAVITTLAGEVSCREDLFNPHMVKVVTNQAGYALYFSRAPIPWHRDAFAQEGGELSPEIPFLRHIGLYAYRAGFLKRYVQWPTSPLEGAESLEQLRVLWHGEPIHVSLAQVEPGHGVDTEDDLTRVDQLLNAGGKL